MQPCITEPWAGRFKLKDKLPEAMAELHKAAGIGIPGKRAFTTRLE